MTTPTQPVGVDIRSWADVRAFVYFVAPLAAAVLTSYGVIEDSLAQLWVALVLAIVGPLLSAFLSKSGIRTAIYVVVGAANALLVAYGLLAADQLDVWLPIANAILGGSAGFLAVRHTQANYALAA